MTFIVATNIFACRPPKHRPTGTPHARAKIPGTGGKYMSEEESSFQRTKFHGRNFL